MSRKTVQRIRLANLYKSEETYQVVYNYLEAIFDKAFEILIKIAKDKKPFLVEPALLMEGKIKRYFIEFGYNLDSINDIEELLIKFKAFYGRNCEFTKARDRFYGFK